jgi:hypothetical protein
MAINVALGLTATFLMAAVIAGPGPTPAQASVSTESRATTARSSIETTVAQSVTSVPRTTPPTSIAPPPTTALRTTVPVTTPPASAPAAPPAPPPSRPQPVSAPTTVSFATTPVSTAVTTTTLPSIGSHLPVPPSTVPLRTKAQSAHVSPVFAAFSIAGFFVALVIMATRFVLTRPRRQR